MATAKSTTKTKTAPATNAPKKGQQAKTPAPVRPAIPTGYTGNVDGLTAAKAGTKPSAHYPQGDASIKLLAKADRMGKDQQANWDAIHKALGGNTGTLPEAIKGGATRRNVRRLARAGYLVWKV